MQNKPIQSVKKFYFLDYFYVLLKSVEKYSKYENIFNNFKILKQEKGLGESKYKKLTTEKDDLSKVQLDRYKYTFGQVIDESLNYNLIKQYENQYIELTNRGQNILKLYENNGSRQFDLEILKLMESNYNAFRKILSLLYQSNKYRPGLLVFPIYSPRLLGFNRSDVKTSHDIIKYSIALQKKIEKDVYKYIGKDVNLEEVNLKIIKKLVESGLLSENPKIEFDPKKYNAITKRFRDFWINYFLHEFYHYDHSMSSFDLWIYRGKQLGIFHATEFFPNLNGRMVFPTSIVSKKVYSKDFKKVFTYDDDENLFLHEPAWDSIQENFVDLLVDAYFELRKSYRSYFINLASLREVVCYKMKISELTFGEYLSEAYKLNLNGELKIKISLEVDKLPEETKATYLKQEPVMIDGKYRNIIAIDVTNTRG